MKIFFENAAWTTHLTKESTNCRRGNDTWGTLFLTGFWECLHPSDTWLQPSHTPSLVRHVCRTSLLQGQAEQNTPSTLWQGQPSIAFQEIFRGRRGGRLWKSAHFVRLQPAQAAKGFLLPAIQPAHPGSNWSSGCLKLLKGLLLASCNSWLVPE